MATQQKYIIPDTKESVETKQIVECHAEQSNCRNRQGKEYEKGKRAAFFSRFFQAVQFQYAQA
jgi:hypothetical protein